MALLYRGVSKELDLKNLGQLKPKGKKNKEMARYDGKISANGHFTYGPSEHNAVRAHHIETGLYDGCYVSTTRYENIAKCFATNRYKKEGWIYIIDESLLEQYGVRAIEFPNPEFPDQMEVTLRASNNRNIPLKVCIEKYKVDSKGKKID